MITEKYNYEPMSRVEVGGKRRYATPDGNKLPSVTTVLDATKPWEEKKALMEWRKRVGEQKAQQITTEAAGRGTRMHKWLENYVINDDTGEAGTNPFSQQSHKMAHIIIEQGLVNCDEYWGAEVPLYFPKIYAGTTDLVGVHNGEPAIIDFKQTNRPKTKDRVTGYYLQLAAYAQAHNEVHGTNIRKGVILMCSKDFEYQEFILEGEEFDLWSDYWFKRLEEYYSKHF